MDTFRDLCYMSVMLSYLFLAALWSTAGNGSSSWLVLSCVMFFLCFCHFPILCTGSDGGFDCIDSWSLPSSLLC